MNRYNGQIPWYPRIDAGLLAKSPHIDFIPGLKAYQQTTDYTCGPAALLTLAKFYEMPGILEDAQTEMRIARELGTRDPRRLAPGEKAGTTPLEMVAWLKLNGFEVTLTFEERGDYSSLFTLRDNIRKGVPSLVEWVDSGGHWVIAVGYDDRGTETLMDDVLIFADPFDRYDDYQDGYTFFNAERFYWMWFDALYSDRVTWRPMITATPTEPFRVRATGQPR